MRPTTYEKNDYRLEDLTDEKFEELCFIILNNSQILKQKINYDSAFYISGGRDNAKDATLQRNNKTIGISQSKHSKKNSNMPINIIRDEIIKVLLYFNFGIIKKIEEKKIPYLFFISSKISEKNFDTINNFKTEIMENDKFKKQVKTIIKKYSKLKNKIDINNYDFLYESLYKKLNIIYKELNIIFYTGNDIQNFLMEKDIEVFIPRFFKVKMVSKNNNLEFPSIEDQEVEEYKARLENLLFKKKLEEIKLKDQFIEQAAKDFSYKNLVVLSLLKFNHLELKKAIKTFEEEILNKEKIKRELNLINLSDQLDNDKPFKQFKESKKYYLNFINDLSNGPSKIQYLDYLPVSFSRGTVQDLVNDKKIEGWLIKLKDIEEEN